MIEAQRRIYEWCTVPPAFLASPERLNEAFTAESQLAILKQKAKWLRADAEERLRQADAEEFSPEPDWAEVAKLRAAAHAKRETANLIDPQ